MGLSSRIITERAALVVDIALTIDPGMTVALLGPNGAGKSTVHASLAGLLPLTDGRIVLNGRVLDDPDHDVFLPADQRRVGAVFQDYLLFPHLSVLENVAFGLRARNESKERARIVAGEWLERVGMSEMSDRRPGDLSGGQAQRVALARALVTQPELLLLDEPLAALDVRTKAELRRVLADHLSGFAGPRLLITHDPADAFLLADEICVIEDGSVTQIGSSEDIRMRPRSAYVADLAGVNHVVGSATNGDMSVGDHMLRIGDTAALGPVVATIHPRAISIHLSRPEGSPRNSWRTTIERVEHYGDRVRIETGAPLPLTAEVTPAAVSALGLTVGSPVWASIKATEITVQVD